MNFQFVLKENKKKVIDLKFHIIFNKENYEIIDSTNYYRIIN